MTFRQYAALNPIELNKVLPHHTEPPQINCVE